MYNVPQKRLPIEVKRWCRMFEFKCFKSLMAQKCIERYSREFLSLVFTSDISISTR